MPRVAPARAPRRPPPPMPVAAPSSSSTAMPPVPNSCTAIMRSASPGPRRIRTRPSATIDEMKPAAPSRNSVMRRSRHQHPARARAPPRQSAQHRLARRPGSDRRSRPRSSPHGTEPGSRLVNAGEFVARRPGGKPHRAGDEAGVARAGADRVRAGRRRAPRAPTATRKCGHGDEQCADAGTVRPQGGSRSQARPRCAAIVADQPDRQVRAVSRCGIIRQPEGQVEQATAPLLRAIALTSSRAFTAGAPLRLQARFIVLPTGSGADRLLVRRRPSRTGSAAGSASAASRPAGRP